MKGLYVPDISLLLHHTCHAVSSLFQVGQEGHVMIGLSFVMRLTASELCTTAHSGFTDDQCSVNVQYITVLLPVVSMMVTKAGSGPTSTSNGVFC